MGQATNDVCGACESLISALIKFGQCEGDARKHVRAFYKELICDLGTGRPRAIECAVVRIAHYIYRLAETKQESQRNRKQLARERMKHPLWKAFPCKGLRGGAQHKSIILYDQMRTLNLKSKKNTARKIASWLYSLSVVIPKSDELFFKGIPLREAETRDRAIRRKADDILRDFRNVRSRGDILPNIPGGYFVSSRWRGHEIKEADKFAPWPGPLTDSDYKAMWVTFASRNLVSKKSRQKVCAHEDSILPHGRVALDSET